MKKFFYSYLALFILAVILNAAYDPTTGTGGGDVFTSSNNNFNAVNTFNATTVFNSNVNINAEADYTAAPPILTIGTNWASWISGSLLGIGVAPAAVTGPAISIQAATAGGSRYFEVDKQGRITIINGSGSGGGSAGAYFDSDEIQFTKNGGMVMIRNLSATANSSFATSGGTGAGSSNILQASGVDVLNATSNRVAISSTTAGNINGGLFFGTDVNLYRSAANILSLGTSDDLGMSGTAVITSTRTFNALGASTAAAPGYSFNGDTDTGLYRPAADTLAWTLGGVEAARMDVSRLAVTNNITSRGFGVAVSAISPTTNSLLQVFSGTYSGAPATVTFGTVYAGVPTVVVTTTESGGTALMNDTVFVTNVTTSTCVIGYRTAAGGSSAATITFNGIALGRQ